MESNALTQIIKALVPLYKYMDIGVEIDSPHFRCHVPYRDEVNGHVNTVHAAFQWASAEMLGGLVALHVFGGLDDIFLVVQKVSIEFLRPAKSDITAETTFDKDAQRRLRDGLEDGDEREFLLDVDVKDAEGVVVAKMSGAYLVRPRRKS